VVAVLGLLLLGGLVGIEAWPVTEWRLFSAARDDRQTTHVVAAATDDEPGGALVPFDLEDLPLGYRTAEWPMSRLSRLSSAERAAICSALYDGIADAIDDPSIAVEIWRDEQRLVERDGEWVTTHDVTILQGCQRGALP
jgi:hypothetical protein